MKLRNNNLAQLSREQFDVLILGGGINGAVAAAALSAKGAKVALIDKGDFASQASSNSSNLIWGGIKYLESFEFFLVHKLCKSRNHLMRSYPSSVKEITFLTTMHKRFRFPLSLAYLGTFIYWIFGGFFTRSPGYLNLKKLSQAEPLINGKQAIGAVEYSDCYLHDNDARFVFNFIRSALDTGATVANYVESLGAQRVDGVWQTQAKDTVTGATFSIHSKILINACGPFADQHNQLTQQHTEHKHLFSKGVHLIVNRLTDHHRVLAFFASDGRLFFVIPMSTKTCIGTTDTPVDTPQTSATEHDRQFILDNINAFLKLDRPLTKDDIIAERCGVRPLAIKGDDGEADWVKLSRKHAIEVNKQENHLSIFGGKLTDCINVGNEVSDIVADLDIELPYAEKIWYGEPSDTLKNKFIQQAKAMNLDSMTPQSSSEPLTQRLWRRYGSHAFEMLESIQHNPDNATLLIENAEYLRCELQHSAKREMITKLEDFLRRRSKIELVTPQHEIIKAKGLREACEILFGDLADEKLNEYLHAEPGNEQLHNESLQA